MTRTILIGISAAFAAGLLFVNVYNSVIDAANWSSAIPDSIATTRAYYHTVNPGNFFRIASPINQVLGLITVIACWKFGRARYFALAALLLAVSADMLTFGYFYPRLEIMFSAPLSSVDNIRQAVADWSSMNWFRSAICTVNTFCAFAALVITAKKQTL